MKTIPMNAVAERAAEFGGRVSELVGDVRGKAETARRDVTQNLRRTKRRAEDLLDEGRHGIKDHPISAVSAFLVAGLALGFAAGLLTGKRR
ncbi:MAG: hypothetical protein ABIP12_06350 [Terriglobales bacterium]